MRRVYRADIDGLRALAVGAVVLFHTFPSLLPGGFVGVDIFFVISGFLITGIVAGEFDRGEFTYRAFYARRLRRLAPALVVVVGATAAAGWFILRSDELADLGRHIAASSIFLSNFLLWYEVGYFEPAAHQKPLLHLWSLAVEEQFYLIWPPLLAAIWRYAFRYRVPVLGAIVIASFVYSEFVVHRDEAFAFFSPFSRLWQLGLGGLLSIVLGEEKGRATAIRHVASVAGLLLIATAFARFNAFTVYPGWRALLPTVGAVALIWAGPTALINRVLLANRLAVGIGLISYPLYLWHWPPIAFSSFIANTMGEDHVPRSIRLAIAVASIGLAWATYRFVEVPIRRRRGSAWTIGSLTAAVPTFLCLGVVLHVMHGFPSRTADSDPQAQFLAHYARMRNVELPAAYRSECDYYDWETKRRRSSIEPSCLTPGLRATWFLWGDSHAQALSLGIRSNLPEGVALAQVATSGCSPNLGLTSRGPSKACDPGNAEAKRAIEALKPELLILAQATAHQDTDWDGIARFAKEAGVRHVVLIGPTPQWLPGLPQRVVSQRWDERSADLRLPAFHGVIELDRSLTARFANSDLLTYVSLIQPLCQGDLCRAAVPAHGSFELLVLDYGHLTPEGSRFVGREILSSRLRAIAGGT